MHLIFLKNGYPNIKCLFDSLLKSSELTLLRCLSAQQKPATKREVSSTTLQPKYNPKDVESQWYDWWESQNYFKPSKPEAESFVILLPPPNVTGTLHLGHTLTATIQDIILRWRKMKGESVLWVPGVDHAGIATQVALEKYLSHTLGVPIQNLKKEEIIKKAWEWKKDKESSIIQQLRDMGASLDWSKFKFTMDSAHSEVVMNAFIQLYNEGLIFRKKSLVNWSCFLKSSISDIEVDWVEIEKRTQIDVPGYKKPIDFGVLYDFAYKVCDEDEEIVVSTSRPETMLGDVAIAIHPDNLVHSKFKNKHVWHPFRKEKIPIILDEFVDRTLGSGAVKITPSHSPVDFEIGLKHNLQSIEVINEEGRLHKVGHMEKFYGLNRFDARKVIIDELKTLGLFRGYNEHPTKIPICSRSGDVIEFILKDQWFLNCKSISENALSAIKNGDLKIEPEKFVSVCCEWLENCKDWNLSRQLWWGHQIPMYECSHNDSRIWIPALSLEEAKKEASRKFETSAEDITVVRDPDVLDTWFSSCLLPLSVLPKSESSLRKLPVISLMVSGHDILFFWIARMVMLSQRLTGKLPFNSVFLHSLLCDSKGKKMSKSLGNVIQPEDIINGRTSAELQAELDNKLKTGVLTKKNYQIAMKFQKQLFPNGIPECGVDALRFTLCCYNVQNYLIHFDIEQCHANRHFCNKMWQALIYFIKITDNYKSSCTDDCQMNFSHVKNHINYLNVFDRWILSRLADTIKKVDEGIANFNFFLATKAIRQFWVEEFCSFYLESSKTTLKKASLPEYNTTISVFYHCMETGFRFLSPFMPFLSEHLYQALPLLQGFQKSESVTLTEFPSAASWHSYRDVNLDKRFEMLSKILDTLRSVRLLYKLTPKKAKVFLKCEDDLASFLFTDVEPVISNLAKVESISRVSSDFKRENVIVKLIDTNCAAYVKHEYDKEALLKLLGLTINKEKTLKQTLESLLKAKSEPKWANELPSVKALHMKKIANAEKELKKIEEFKEVLSSCER